MNESQEKVFLSVYDTYADAIFRYCYVRVFNRELAQDLVQETFLRLWNNYVKESENVENARALVYRIATNLIIDERRKKRVISLTILQEKGVELRHTDNEKALEQHIEGKWVGESIQKLPPPYQAPVFLRYMEEFSVQEIAGILGESENVISVRIHRGLKKLRALLNEDNHGKKV